MATSDTVPRVSVDELRQAVKGRVIEPTEPDYDALRTVMLGGVDPRPAVIVRPVDDADIAEVVGYAQASGLPLAVRSGGHSGAGHGSVDGGVVLDLRDMTALDLDVDSRTVWAEAGLTAGQLTSALAPHGLAVGFGDTGSVGISGITLSGGVGYLARKHGLTIDNVLAADVVTADGRRLRVDAGSHPDLFWGIRGGGGNFGVVSRFQYQLHEVGDVVGGILVLPATAETVAGWVAAAEAAPEELTTIANVMPCPPLPFVPAERHGELVIMALVCFAGDAEAGAAAFAPFRGLPGPLGDPLADMVRPVPYPELFPPADPDYHPTAVNRTLFMDDLDRDLAAVLVDRLATSDASMRVAQIRVLGGAVARVPVDATAYAHRESRIMVTIAAFVDEPADREARTAWVGETAALLDQGNPGAYVAFVGDEGPDRVRAAYPGSTWDRLVQVKSLYDPTNLFQRCQNVPPAEML